MKKCPNCNCIVIKDNYCDICSTCVIYETNIIKDETKMVFNKYVFFHYLKRLLIPIICFITVIVFTILIGDIKHEYHLIIVAIALSIISILSGIFENHIINWNLKYWTKEYSRFRIRFANILSSIFSLSIIITIHSVK